jgi:hypothetical protein
MGNKVLQQKRNRLFQRPLNSSGPKRHVLLLLLLLLQERQMRLGPKRHVLLLLLLQKRQRRHGMRLYKFIIHAHSGKPV